MKIILLLIVLVCFSLMGFLYYRFCKKTSEGFLNILKKGKK
ncbi:MAG: hypothetical protein U9Q08_03715 [Candidatus Omnitrophota bacterium]|nr:hypothetical protein [Candidatus Omnitrophota bacterium]